MLLNVVEHSIEKNPFIGSCIAAEKAANTTTEVIF